MHVQSALSSPRITQLQRTLEAEDQTALDRFWQEISKHGGPLIEPVEGNDTLMYVSFLWKDLGNTSSVIILGGPATTGELIDHRLQCLPGTNLWYKTYLVPANLRTTYQFLLNNIPPASQTIQNLLLCMETAQPDPLNTHQVSTPLGLPGRQQQRQASVLELPRAPAQPWAIPRTDLPAGNMKMSLINSHILQHTYSVAVYTPPGYTTSGDANNMLLLFDGWMYINNMRLPIIMDNLLHAGKIPPTVVVLLTHLDYATRLRELLCYHPFTDFLIQELYPWLHERYHLTQDPACITVGGISAGGVAAAFAGLIAPELFGNVLAQSGTFWSSGGIDGSRRAEWLTEQFAQQPKQALRFSLEIGLFDRYPQVDPIAANQRFYQTLLTRGYEVSYNEFNGGHDFICWRGSFADRFLSCCNKRGKI